MQAQARSEWAKFDVLVVPTAAYNYTVQEIQVLYGYCLGTVLNSAGGCPRCRGVYPSSLPGSRLWLR